MSNQILIGKQIKMIRVGKGLHIKHLGDLSGVHYSYISAIENSNMPPRPDQLQAIEAALGIRFSDPAVQAAFSVLLGQRDGDLSNAQ